MREGWTYKKLGDVCLVTMGQSPDSKSYNTEKRGLPFFQGCSDFGELHPTIKTYCDAPNKIAEPLDILMSVRAPVGTLNIANVKCCIGRGLASFRQKVDTSLYKFLYYFLKSSQTDFQDKSTGATFKAIGKDLIVNYPISLPPLSIQQQIVSELDLLSSVIEKQKAQIEELDKLAQSIFYDMFGDPVENEKGWEVKKLKEVSLEKLSYGSGASAIPYNGSVRYIRITDINNNGELNDDVVSPNIIDEKYSLNDGDILFARSGATVGKTYCHKEKYGKCVYAGYLIKLVPNKDLVLPSYVYGYTKTSYYLSFIANTQNAVAQPNINAKQYGDLCICVPPLSLQQQFASKIEAVEKQKELIKQSIQETETLFNSRMDYYFN